MSDKPNIDSLYEKALALEAFANDLVLAAEASRIAFALAIRSHGKPGHPSKVSEALRTLPDVAAAAAEVTARAALVAALKKK